MKHRRIHLNLIEGALRAYGFIYEKDKAFTDFLEPNGDRVLFHFLARKDDKAYLIQYLEEGARTDVTRNTLWAAANGYIYVTFEDQELPAMREPTYIMKKLGFAAVYENFEDEEDFDFSI